MDFISFLLMVCAVTLLLNSWSMHRIRMESNAEIDYLRSLLEQQEVPKEPSGFDAQTEQALSIANQGKEDRWTY